MPEINGRVPDRRGPDRRQPPFINRRIGDSRYRRDLERDREDGRRDSIRERDWERDSRNSLPFNMLQRTDDSRDRINIEHDRTSRIILE